MPAVAPNMMISAKKYPWQGINDKLLFCYDYDRGYYMY